MSLVKKAIQSLAEKGKLVHEFEVKGISFSMQVLTTEEQLVADSLVDPEYLNKKFKSKNLNTFRDTMEKHRLISQMAFAIREVDGQSPVDHEKSLEDQFKQREEFKDELSNLDVVILDRLVAEYNTLIIKHKEFLADTDENIKK